MSRLLELSLPKRRHVERRELKPLTIRPPVGKAPVPVGLDTRRIVGANGMNGRQFFRERNSDFFNTTLKVIAAADFVEVTGLKQIDKSLDGLWANDRVKRRRAGAWLGKHIQNVGIVSTFSGESPESFNQFFALAEVTLDSIDARNRRFRFAPKVQFGVCWDTPVMPAGLRVFLKHVIRIEARNPLVGLVTCLR